MPPGFLGTRADLLVDSVLILNLLAPFWAWFAAKKARAGEHDRHKKLQAALCVLMFCALFSLEGSIRMHGGSGSLVAGSPYAGTTLLKTVFLLHIGPAVLTYLVWLWLTIKSWRGHRNLLPGPFSRRHRTVGWVIVAGLVWTALSAIFVYYFGFVASGAAPAA